MKLYNKNTFEKINFNCYIDGKNVAYEIIKGAPVFSDYILNNEYGEMFYVMDDRQIEYWNDIFLSIEAIRNFKEKICKKNENLFIILFNEELASIGRIRGFKDRIDFTYKMHKLAYYKICHPFDS
jgi:hypothetical protein